MPGFRRGPDDLTQGLTAFTRAIRCHRRLARLAPRSFDASVVDQERRERAEQRRWMALWETALAKAYGCKPDTIPPDPAADLPPLPSPRIQRAVERELAGWDFWMAAGRLAMDRHQQRRPHALMSLTRLARLLQISMDFGLLAVGRPAQPETSFESRCENFMADLERAYGQRPSPSADTESLPAKSDSLGEQLSLQTRSVGSESSRAGPEGPPNLEADPMGTIDSQAGSAAGLLQDPPTPSQATTSQPSAVPASPPSWPPPDDKQDLIPHALVIGPHGLLCLQPIRPRQT
jgi:hypothetical protein